MHGKDRTGLIAMLLLGLCGVEEPAIVRDYALSEARLKAGRSAGRLSELGGAPPPAPPAASPGLNRAPAGPRRQALLRPLWRWPLCSLTGTLGAGGCACLRPRDIA